LEFRRVLFRSLELQEELTHELYRTVPPAPPHGIAHFMSWLWRQEINELGMPTQLPRDFQDWLERARRATPGGKPIANQHDEEPTRPDQTRTKLRRTRRAALSRFR